MDAELIPKILAPVPHKTKETVFFPGPKFILPEGAGIVHVYAQWSHEALDAWSTLMAVLSEISSVPPVYVVLSDYGAEFMISVFNELSHGYGATYWVKDGKIIQKIHRYNGATPEIADTIRQYTAEVTC